MGTEETGLPGEPGGWQARLDHIVETMREMSLEADPQAMVRAYGTRMRALSPDTAFMAVSRRDLEPPQYRITRSSRWTDEVNPWKEKDRLPLLEGGLLGELLYGDRPRIINDLIVAAADPAHEHLADMRSLMALPNYDRGVALNMTIRLSKLPGAFDPEALPEQVWLSNLFGRATQNLVLSDELKQANDALERELKVVADIQRSLLPRTFPSIPTLDLAAHYQTSKWAGGDYYDVFRLPDGLWGLLIADVSGHGTPAAVIMAITHALAHTYSGAPIPPGRMLHHVNHHLTTRYTSEAEAFVTAFYGIYDPARRQLQYASAGHNPPRLKQCSSGAILSLDGARNLPLGILNDEDYEQFTQALAPGDQLILYTDGITEANSPDGRMYGTDRLDAILSRCHDEATGLIDAVLADLDTFTAGQPPADDQTLLVARVS